MKLILKKNQSYLNETKIIIIMAMKMIVININTLTINSSDHIKNIACRKFFQR